MLRSVGIVGTECHGGSPGRFQSPAWMPCSILDRSAFDYPGLLQDPRVFFPIPAL